LIDLNNTEAKLLVKILRMKKIHREERKEKRVRACVCANNARVCVCNNNNNNNNEQLVVFLVYG